MSKPLPTQPLPASRRDGSPLSLPGLRRPVGAVLREAGPGGEGPEPLHRGGQVEPPGTRQTATSEGESRRDLIVLSWGWGLGSCSLAGATQATAEALFLLEEVENMGQAREKSFP